MIKVNVVVEGKTPILMNNGLSMGINSKMMEPQDICKEKVYQLEDKRLYVPTLNMRNSIIAGGGQHKSGKTSFKTLMAGILQAIEPEDCLLIKRNGEYLYTWDSIDARRAVIQGNGIITYRPLIKTPWELEFTMIFDEALIAKKDIKIVEAVISRAGSMIGVCDFRPGSPKNKSGWFGKYIVKSFEIE